MIMTKDPFAHWFEARYLEWRNDQHDRKANLKTFSIWLDVPQSNVSKYLNGEVIPAGDNLFKIASKLGFDCYEILKLPVPDLHEKEWQRLFDMVPPEMKDAAIEAHKKWLKEKGIDYE
jgi:hypothetical protein